MVICMMNYDQKYQSILDEYPEEITKEQLYKICHVSKKTALHYIQNGLIPCTCTGLKTRKYRIKTIDVVRFLQIRDENAEACLAPNGWYAGQYHGFPRTLTPAMQKKVTAALVYVLEGYPDVMSYEEVMAVTGVGHNAILKWCSNKNLRHFNIRTTFMFPKISLVEFLTKDNCQAISEKTYKHVIRLADSQKATSDGQDTSIR